MKEKLVVIGNGMSGLRTIEDLLEINKDKYEITIYGEAVWFFFNLYSLSINYFYQI